MKKLLPLCVGSPCHFTKSSASSLVSQRLPFIPSMVVWNGRRDNRYPWRRQVKTHIGRAPTPRAPFCGTRCSRAARPLAPSTFAVGHWKAGAKTVSEIVTEMVLARRPSISCVPCFLDTALEVIKTLPLELILADRPIRLKWNRIAAR